MTDSGVPIAHFAELQFMALAELAAGFDSDEHRTRFLERMRQTHGTDSARRLRAAIWARMQQQTELFA